MRELFDKLFLYGIIPSVEIDDADKAIPVARALCDGGLPLAEVSMRSPQAADAIANMVEGYPDMLVGASAVLTVKEVDKAVRAGAQFILTQGFNPKLVVYCIEKAIPIIPGISSPSDIEAALKLGLSTLRFFPAGQSGGIAFIKAMSGSYDSARFIPAGGIDLKNLGEYLSCPQVTACSGSWIADSELIKSEKYEAITVLAREAARKVHDFEFVHMGINCENEKEAKEGASRMCSLFGLEFRPMDASVFAGEKFEFTKAPVFGKHGHIGLSANYVPRAYAYLKSLGVKFIESTRKNYDSGAIKFIFLADEICGFSVHIMRRMN